MTTFAYQHGQVWLRDRLVPFADANLSLASSPMLYGLSIYTVFMANWDKTTQQLVVFRLEDHYRRLVHSAKIMNFEQFLTDWSYERFEITMHKLLAQNKVREDVLVRVAVFVDEILAGTKIHGLEVQLASFIYPAGQLLDKEGIHACISSWQRTADNAIPSRAKVNGSYVNASLMKNEALQNGYDEAIALDAQGHITEGTVTNVFMVKNNKLITPDNGVDLLEGITRDSILQIAERLGIACEQRTIDRSELYTADEAFMSGSSAGLVPILSVDKRMIGTGLKGGVTQRLASYFEALIHGQKQDFPHWLTFISV